MIRKVVVVAVLVGLIGVLVVGTINRTNARSGQEAGLGYGRAGQTSGEQAEGKGNGGQWGGRETTPVAPGNGAQAVEWATVSGVVVSVQTDALLVKLDDGSSVEIVDRAWRFALQSGFDAHPGDALTLVGFYENEDFEVVKLTNQSTGQTTVVRDESGRPLWAGRGRSRS